MLVGDVIPELEVEKRPNALKIAIPKAGCPTMIYDLRAGATDIIHMCK